MLYKMTKGTLSRIRNNEAGVKDLQKDGYVLEGSCDPDGNLISTAVTFDAAKKAPATKPQAPKADKKEGEGTPAGEAAEEPAAGGTDEAAEVSSEETETVAAGEDTLAGEAAEA